MKKIIALLFVTFISTPSIFAQCVETQPTPNQEHWMASVDFQLLNSKINPIALEDKCTGLVISTLVATDDGGRTASYHPKRNDRIKVLIATTDKRFFLVDAIILRTPSSWDNVVTCGNWVPDRKNPKIADFIYSFQTTDMEDAPVFPEILRKFEYKGEGDANDISSYDQVFYAYFKGY